MFYTTIIANRISDERILEDYIDENRNKDISRATY